MIDDDLLAPRVSEFLRKRARQQVGDAAWHEADDETYRARWVFLRAGHRRRNGNHQRDSASHYEV